MQENDTDKYNKIITYLLRDEIFMLKIKVINFIAKLSFKS